MAIIRSPLQCTSCRAITITRTAPGLFPPNEHRFPCPGCGVEIRYTLKRSKNRRVGYSFTRPVNGRWVKSEKGAVATLTFDPDRVASKDMTNVFSPFLDESMKLTPTARAFYAREEGLRRNWQQRTGHLILGTQFLFWTWEWASWQKRGVATLRREMSRLAEESYEIEKETGDAKRMKDTAKLERLREREKRYLERFDAHWARISELDAKDNLLVLMGQRTGFLRILSIIGGGVGLILTVAGFWLWFQRVQVHQDRALRETKKR